MTQNLGLQANTVTMTDELSQVSKIPVKVTHDIPTDTWRLVIVVEDVLLGGRL